MNSPPVFRRQLAVRLAALITLGGAASMSALASSCGSSDTTLSGAAGPYMGTENECFPWTPDAGGGTGGGAGTGGADGGTGGSGGAGGSGSTSGSSSASGAGGAGGAAGAECPSQQDAKNYLTPGGCGLFSVDSPGARMGQMCCYQVTVTYCIGRPLLDGGRPIVAGVTEGSDAWADVIAPDLTDLGPEERAALAEAYTRDALLEHASIASFARFSLELLSIGAPASLVAAAHEAALDEVRHARACFALASAYGGAAIGPSALPLGRAMDITPDLPQIVERAVEEGCVGETIAAMLAAEQAYAATDPAVRAALSAIAADEARHAELAWKTLAWAINVGGEPVRAAARRAFERAVQGALSMGDGVDHRSQADADRMAAHGRLRPEAMERARRLALEEVVLPSARAALSFTRPPTVISTCPVMI